MSSTCYVFGRAQDSLFGVVLMIGTERRMFAFSECLYIISKLKFLVQRSSLVDETSAKYII